MTTIETIHGASAARTGRHVLKRILAALAVATCMLDASAANQAPSVAMQSPVNGASYAAPAAVTLVASASDSDGSIARVEFFNGAELLGTSTSAPYQFTWTGVPAGTYAVTARATDDLGGQTTTAVAPVTVTSGGAQVYFVYSDQINTPKEIINAAGVKVWQGDSEPFGANPPMENPAGQGVFTYNLRFPGQYFDRETGLHYNYHRDYDPQTGRYVQSDPIGLDGGVNTYGYALENPVSNADPSGLFVPPGLPPGVVVPPPIVVPPPFVVVAAGAGAAAVAGVGVGMAINYGVESWSGGSVGTNLYDYLNPEMSERSKERDRKKSASVTAANIIARAQGKNQADPADDECDKQEKRDEEACSKLRGAARAACYGKAARDAAECRDRLACKK